MNIADKVQKTGIYIGKMHITQCKKGNDVFELETKFSMTDFKVMGDLVYFCFNKQTEDFLLKIGKTTDNTAGFYTRMRTYMRKDQTTDMMIRKMKEYGITELDVFAVQIPRETITRFDPITEQSISIEVSCAEAWEKKYQATAQLEGFDLPLCRQKG